jgi:hypothetical protein
MLILFDNGTPAPLRYALKGHVVVERAAERPFQAVIPIPQARERNLALSVFKAMRDSSSSANKNGGLPGMTGQMGFSAAFEAIEPGWDWLLNGELIAAAEAAGFELLVTTDKNMRYPLRAVFKGRWR